MEEKQVNRTESSTTKVEETVDSWLPEEYRDHKVFKDIKDVNTLAKNYLNAQELIGKKKKDLVRPESKDEYKFENIDDQVASWFKDAAYEAGVGVEPAAKLVESYMDLEKHTRQKFIDNSLSSLKEEFKGDFDSKIELARKAVEDLGGSELKDYLNQTGLGNHPAMVKAFLKAGESTVEHRLVDHDTISKAAPERNATDIRTELDNLKRSSDFKEAFHNARHPKHSEIKDKFQKLVVELTEHS